MPYYEYDKDYPFAAFITNLGKYNEGELVGEWVRFPTTAEEMKKVFDRIGIGQRIRTARGSFAVTDMSREQMEPAGYGYHHSSDDGKYLIMGNGTRAFAILAEQPEKDNPLRTAEMTIEDDYGMIDGVINNGRRRYNKICAGCVHPCKQSFRAELIECPHYHSKRSKNCGDKGAKSME